MPLQVEITGWSPFEPGDPDNASLPVAALEYRFTNHTRKAQEAVFSWNARNFMPVDKKSSGGAADALVQKGGKSQPATAK